MGVATGCGCKEVYRFPHATMLALKKILIFIILNLKKNVCPISTLHGQFSHSPTLHNCHTRF